LSHGLAPPNPVAMSVRAARFVLPFASLALCAPALCALALSGCGFDDDGPFEIAVIEGADELYASGNRLSIGAKHLRAATEWGLVTLDADGEVVPALAERWIITDDGQSFIFRLSERNWPDGQPMDSASVRRSLERVIAGLRGTSLGLDLAPIKDVRAMAGRVVEIRLSAPVPDLLTLLAQPELALRASPGGTGPMALSRDGALARLQFRPPLERGLPDMPGWESEVRELTLVPVHDAKAMTLFDEGEVQVVLGGRIGQIPLADTGPLSRGTVRIDPAVGLFGLRIRSGRGMLGDASLREALAMALDRPGLLERYNVGGWQATTRIVAPGLPGDSGLIGERWEGEGLDQLRAAAAARVRAWQARSGEAPVVRLSLGDAPGDTNLLTDLAAQFATIGVRLVRAERLADADLVLVDEVARYGDPRWFLNQFNCSLRRGLCNQGADRLVAAAQGTIDHTERARLLADAESALLAANIYVPIGAPLRWSLVRGSVTGFAPNAYAFHPLPPLAELPK